MATTHAAAGPYQVINDPSDLNAIAQDQASFTSQLVYPELLGEATIDVGAATGVAGVENGSVNIPSARSLRNYDPKAQIGVGINAPLPDASNFFPREPITFSVLKYGGKGELLSEAKMKGYDNAGMSLKERSMVNEAAVKYHYDKEYVLANKLMTAANWTNSAMTALPGGGGKKWNDVTATPVADLIALFESHGDSCGEAGTHLVIPEKVARVIAKHPEARGYFVTAGAAGTAAAFGGEQNIGRGALRAMIQAMLNDEDKGFGTGGVKVVIPKFRPFVKSKRATATSADRAWAWGDNQIGMYHLRSNGAAIRAGSEFELPGRTGLVLAEFAPVEAKFRTNVDGSIYADAYGVFDMPILDSDYGYVVTAVVT